MSDNRQQQQQQQTGPIYKYKSEAESRATQFPWKLHEMLEEADEKGMSHIVSWLDNGNGFVVHDLDAFVAELMPIYFKQTKYKSFQRQLNMWGFRKVRTGRDRGAICNEFFVRGQPDLCKQMKRIKVKGLRTRQRPTAASVARAAAADPNNNGSGFLSFLRRPGSAFHQASAVAAVAAPPVAASQNNNAMLQRIRNHENAAGRPFPRANEDNLARISNESSEDGNESSSDDGRSPSVVPQSPVHQSPSNGGATADAQAQVQQLLNSLTASSLPAAHGNAVVLQALVQKLLQEQQEQQRQQQMAAQVDALRNALLTELIANNNNNNNSNNLAAHPVAALLAAAQQQQQQPVVPQPAAPNGNVAELLLQAILQQSMNGQL